MKSEHPLIVKKLQWLSEKDTEGFAQSLAQSLLQEPGLMDVVLELQGNLGTGKTTFARYLLQALGVDGRIKSPTYAVVEPYRVSQGAPSGRAPFDIWHFDFYRFNSPEEWEEAGFRDIFASKGLKLVEWAEKAGPYQPEADLVLALQYQALETLHSQSGEECVRQVTLSAHTLLGKKLLE